MESMIDIAESPPAELEARQRAWLIRRDPRVLWPGLDLAKVQAAVDAIASAARALVARQPAALPHGDGSHARATGVAALVTGMGPLLGWHVEHDLLRCDAHVDRVLREHLRHARLRRRRMMSELIPALRALRAAGITPIVIKGMHTAARYFPDPATKPLADADVVVRPEEIARAEAALLGAGLMPARRVERPYKRNWYPPSGDRRVWSLELWHERSPWALELHSGLSFGHTVANGVQFEIAGHFDVADSIEGTPVRIAASAPLVALLAVHLSTELYSSRLLRVYELVAVARKEITAGRLAWSDVEAVLGAIGALRYAYPAFSLVEQLAPGLVPPDLLARCARESTRGARRVVAALTLSSNAVEDSVSLRQCFMWSATPAEVLRRAALFLSLRGNSLPVALAAYGGRAKRLLTGHVNN